MKKYASFFVGAALLASAAIGPIAASAQTSQTMMPVLYDQSGTAVNTGVSKLPAGNYYLQPGGAQPVYYYGNGVYYNAATGQYGGSTSDPNGTSGASLGYTTTGGTVSATPGVPNTGAGGDSSTNWSLLLASGVVVLAGAAFLSYSFSRQKMA